MLDWFYFSILIFKGNSILFFFVVAAPILHSHPQYSLFSTSSPICVICGLFHDSNSDRCEIISWFWFTFLWWLTRLSVFSCTYRSSLCVLWKNFYSGSLSIFIIRLFFWYWIVWGIHIFWILTAYWLCHLKIFSPYFVSLICVFLCQYHTDLNMIAL